MELEDDRMEEETEELREEAGLEERAGVLELLMKDEELLDEELRDDDLLEDDLLLELELEAVTHLQDLQDLPAGHWLAAEEPALPVLPEEPEFLLPALAVEEAWDEVGGGSQ